VTPADSELIAHCLTNDETEAFGELVRRHQSAVRRFLRHLTRGDAALADDLAQETFIQAHRGLARFRPDTQFETWLLGISHNQFRNARRRHRGETPLSEMDQEEASSPSSERLSDLQLDLTSALSQLSADEQLALMLSFQIGLTHSEIAAVLEWPLGTVKIHISRGKDQLRKILTVWNPRK
jgi:RNA polymerase sigma-70 factor (ECF subfamily)